MTQPLVKLFTGNDDWYTPAQYIDAAREVMGSIDIDPASNHLAQAIVKAETYYTLEDNGLTKDWRGNVWMNPPYSKGLLSQFVDKYVYEWNSGYIQQGIVLTNNSSDTKWFSILANRANRVCFTKGRIKFYREKEYRSPVCGQTFFYYGTDVDKFTSVFNEIGNVYGEVL